MSATEAPEPVLHITHQVHCAPPSVWLGAGPNLTAMDSNIITGSSHPGPLNCCPQTGSSNKNQQKPEQFRVQLLF